MTVKEAAEQVIRDVDALRDQVGWSTRLDDATEHFLDKLMTQVSRLGELVAACAPDFKEAP
jgi:hypothetical protein